MVVASVISSLLRFSAGQIGASNIEGARDQIDYLGGQGGGSRLDLERRLHVGMEAAEIVDGAGLLQNVGHGLFRRHHHVEIAVPRGGVVANKVLVPGLKGAA